MAAALGLAVLQACGSESTSVPTGVSTTTPGNPVHTVVITGITPQTEPVVAITTEPLPIAGESPDCEPVLTTAVSGLESTTVNITVTTRRAFPWDGCTLAPRVLQVDLGAANPGGLTDGAGNTFVLYEGRYVQCPAGGQTCNPAPASCGDPTLRDAIANNDVPAHFYMYNKRCAEPFAVVDVDLAAGACPRDDRGPSPCAGQRIDRMFFRIQDGMWILVARGRSAGCADVSAVDPSFPSSMCEDLPAL
jgi:hypothetical protein